MEVGVGYYFKPLQDLFVKYRADNLMGRDLGCEAAQGQSII